MKNNINYVNGEWTFGEMVTFFVNGKNVTRKVLYGAVGYAQTLYVNINGERYARCDLPEFETSGEAEIKAKRKSFNICEGIL